jgi:5-methylcytosine-specific restriction endonuclease McrA
MTREVPEWIGRTDNTAPPPRVKARIYLLAEGHCKHCTRFIDGSALTAEYDHVIPIILGGENRETNLQLLCEPCHAAKTKIDVKLKSKVARVRKAHLGIKKPRAIRSWRRFDGSIVHAARER